MSKKTRSIILTVIVIAGCIGLWYVWTNYGSKPDSSQAPALTQQTNGKIMLDGKVAAEKTAELGFVVAANIVSLPAAVGDTVKAGQVLAVQNSADLRAESSAAYAQVQSAQEALVSLKHQLNVEKLKLKNTSGNAKKQQNQQIASAGDSVIAQGSAIAAAQANLVSAQAQVGKTILTAPFDGIITRQDGQVGEVAGISSAPFMTLASNEAPQKIESYASDLDIAKIKVGDSANVAFDVSGTPKTISAKVISIDPSTDSSQSKMSYKVTLMLDNSDADIKIGMHASVVF